jgi:hypothetical protein
MAIPSITMIPSGYKAEKVYSVLPTNGDGDLFFDRNTPATRVNKNGLIEQVATDIPRLDYSDGSCPSLLLEPERTNLVQYSESFSGWSLDDATIVGNNNISPDGTQNAVLLKGNTNSSRHHIYKTYSQQNSNTAFSVFVKAKELKYVQIATVNDTNQYANFDVSSGVVGTVGGTFSNAKIEAIGTNGWYRLSVVATRSNGLYIGLVSGLTASWLESWIMPNNTDGLYIWGAQSESNASYPTSYIPTSGSSVPRAAETANGSGNSEVFNDSEGVLFADIKGLSNSSTDRRISISDGSISNRIFFYYTPNTDQVSAIIRSGGATQVNISILDLQAKNNKFAIKYKINDVSFWVNGFEIGTDVVATMPSNLSELAFDDGGGSNNWYGKTKELGYYDTALTDEELEYMTSYRSLNELVTELNLNTL